MDAALILANGFLSMALFSVVISQYSVKIKLSSSKLEKNESVTITCDVTNHLSTNVTMSWIRKRGQNETVIARDDKLSEEFHSRKRYHLNRQEITKFNHYIFTLTIQDPKAWDSGEIGCLLPDNHIEIFKTLTVQSPVRSVRLKSTDLGNAHARAYMDNRTEYFGDGDVHRFTCNVSGSYPEPRVRVFVGETDISDTFSRVSRLREEEGSRTEGGRTQFVDDLYYEVVMTNNHLRISHDFNRKRITCIADLPGSDFPIVKTSFEVRLSDFCPKFECGHEIVARRHQHDVELICLVISEPEVVKGSFHWKRSTQGNLSIEAGETDGAFTGYLNSKNEDGTVKQMILRISHMFPQHFRSYVFQAENRKCTSVKEISIQEEDPSRNSQSATTVITTTTRILVIIATTTVFMVDTRKTLT